MDKPDPSNPNPNSIIPNNDSDNSNDDVNPISSQHASNDPSPPPTPTTPPPFKIPEISDDSDSVFKALYHRRVHSDGDFQTSAFDNRGGEPSGDLFNGSSSDTDDLVYKFLKLDEDGGDGDCVDPDGFDGDGDGGEGGRKKSMRRSRSYEARKALPPQKLAGIWSVDAKRVKRILSNRQSAARSKDRKHRYLTELEQQVQSLQSKATNLSAQITIYQRDTTGLTTENAELKIRLQAMEQQAQLGEAVSGALMQELQRLQIATGEITTPNKPPSLGLRLAPSTSLPSPSTSQPVPDSPLTSPSTPQSVHYSIPLTSPSTPQSMHYSSPLTSPINPAVRALQPTNLPINHAARTLQPVNLPINCAVNSAARALQPINLSVNRALQPIDVPFNRAVQCSSLTSPSSPSVLYSVLTSPTTVHSSPLTSPSAAQTISRRAASPSPRTTANAVFPLLRQSVPVLAQLPPLHTFRSRHRFRAANPQSPPLQNDSLCPSQGVDTSNTESNAPNVEGPPVSGIESSSTTQPTTPSDTKFN
ncbi:Transcription factor RF2b like [Actinidia chinensis var. chinensis]|uniref:Transcription factor RF2b like n=1 Tax=Actinidia chinensis var. chinensis TaxID=1590841 RepID=A0A2R6QST0_ACTCC|nr:Transcription factor RF2b like [Actinidia chinensis var. chinensis]